jgi:hypothetical protein
VAKFEKAKALTDEEKIMPQEQVPEEWINDGAFDAYEPQHPLAGHEQ